MTSQKRNGRKKDNGNSNRNHSNSNNVSFWNKARLFVATGLISLPLVVLGASKLVDCSRSNPPKVTHLEHIVNSVDSPEVAERLTIDGFYTNNQDVRSQIKQRISDLVRRQIDDQSIDMKVKVRDFMKLNIFNYYDFVLDDERTNEETYSLFSRIFTDIVNILPSIDPNFESYLEGRDGDVAMDVLEMNSILRPYFETLGYVCMITPDLEFDSRRPNVILMEVGDIKKCDVKCLDKSHTMIYRDIRGVAIPLIQGYKTPGNEVEGMVVGEKGGDHVCLVDTVRERGIAESAWNTLQDSSDKYLPLMKRIFPTRSKEKFISAYIDLKHRSVLVHEATHDLRRSQADKKSFHEEELIAFLNETVEGPSPLYTMLHLLRNGEAPYYRLALSRFGEHVLRGDSPETISEDSLRERARDYLVSLLGTKNGGEGK